MKVNDIIGTSSSASFPVPKIWYHGTEEVFHYFDWKKIGSKIGGMAMIGFWFAESRKAAGYYGPNIVTCYLNIRNPLMVDNKTYYSSRLGPSNWAQEAYLDGYDSVIIENIVDGDTESTVACVFEPRKIRILKFDVWDD